MLGLPTICGVIIICLSQKFVDRKHSQNAYKGTLVEIFRDYKNESQHTYKIETTDSFVYEPVRHYPQSMDYIAVGDSVIKNKGDLSVTIKKADGNSATFYYK